MFPGGQDYQPGQSWQPTIGGRPVDPCATWTCESDSKYGVIKVSNREKCVQDCQLVSGRGGVAPSPGRHLACRDIMPMWTEDASR